MVKARHAQHSDRSADITYITLLDEASAYIKKEDYQRAYALARQALLGIKKGDGVGAAFVITEACVRGNLGFAKLRKARRMCELHGYDDQAARLRAILLKRVEPRVSITAPRASHGDASVVR